jgi:heat shock protein HtpX
MAGSFGLYRHIRANEIRSMVLLASLFGLSLAIAFAIIMLGVGFLVQDAPALEIAHHAWRLTMRSAPAILIGVALWVWIAYFLHQSMIDMMMSARPLDRRLAPAIYNKLEQMCISRGMQMPKLQVIETPAMNAFATGLTVDQYTITLTRGLIENLTIDEIEAVLAHELTHIRNEDVKTLVIAMVMVGMIAFAFEFVWRLVGSAGRRSSGSSRSDGLGKVALAAVAIVTAAWVLSVLVRLSLSRSREYLADAGAVELTKRPEALISALLKIDGRSALPDAPESVREMCLDNPAKGLAGLLSTHPTIEDRIAALERHAGGWRPQDAEIGSPRLARRPA